MGRMRSDRRYNAIAEKLWYVVLEAVEVGVSASDFKEECGESFYEAHLQKAKEARAVFEEKQ